LKAQPKNQLSKFYTKTTKIPFLLNKTNFRGIQDKEKEVLTVLGHFVGLDNFQMELRMCLQGKLWEA